MAALAASAAGCSGGAHEDQSTSAEVAAKRPGSAARVVSRAHPPVRITVIDGDTRRTVPGALVAIGRRADYADGKGVARIALRHRTALNVRVSAPGYATRTVREPFARRNAVVLRVYRPAGQWTMYGADQARSHAREDIRLRPPFRIVWSRGIGSLIEFPAVIASGVAYIGNYKGTVYAIRMRDGDVAWRYDPPGGKMASSPAVWGDMLVVHGMDGFVRVLDRHSGRLRFRIAIGSPIESSPIVAGGVDYFGAWNGRVYALDLARRRFRWIRTTGYKITSSAALSRRTLYIGDYGGRLLALNVRSGRIRFARSVNGRVYGTPAVAGGRVFVPSSTGNSLTAFTTRGRMLWRVRTGGYVYSSPATAAGRVFFGSYDGHLYAVTASKGSILWTASAGGPVSGAAVVVGGVAYAGSTWGRITGVDARSGRVLMRFPHGEYVPISGTRGRLLLHGYSRVYAVEPR
jgi:outer membrane protein assembly factor BamB